MMTWQKSWRRSFDGKDKLTGFVRFVKFWFGLSFLDFLPLKCDACSKLFW